MVPPERNRPRHVVVPTTPAQQGWFGVLFVVLGAGLALMVHAHPERMRAPAWVVYGACAAFAFAGCVMVAQSRGLRRVERWAVVLAIAALSLPGLWISLGTGSRAQCRMSIPFVRTAAPELLCRSAFGLGALVVLLMLVVALRQALRRSADE